jgi:gas vesicle protein
VRRQGGPKFFAGAILGGLLGAGVGVLFAPRSGQETRRRLADRSTTANAEPETLVESLAAALGAAYQRLEQAYQSARLERDEAKRRLSQEWEDSKRTGSAA